MYWITALMFPCQYKLAKVFPWYPFSPSPQQTKQMQSSTNGVLAVLVQHQLTKKIKCPVRLLLPWMTSLPTSWSCSRPAVAPWRHLLRASRLLCQQRFSKGRTFHSSQICFPSSPRSLTPPQHKAKLFTYNQRSMEISLKIHENKST